MSTAANSAIYAGLKFTGLALTVAADLAKSVRKDLITAQEAKVSRQCDLDVTPGVTDAQTPPLSHPSCSAPSHTGVPRRYQCCRTE